MARWLDLEREAPEIADAGRALLVGDCATPAFLATTRGDGGPRVHPVMPVLADGGLYVFVVNLSWKYRDLLRDGRYALHAALPPEGGREFYLTGPALTVASPAARESVRRASGNRLGNLDFEVLFELGLERALLTEWDGWGTERAWPRFSKWPVPRGEASP